MSKLPNTLKTCFLGGPRIVLNGFENTRFAFKLQRTWKASGKYAHTWMGLLGGLNNSVGESPNRRLPTGGTGAHHQSDHDGHDDDHQGDNDDYDDDYDYVDDDHHGDDYDVGDDYDDYDDIEDTGDKPVGE